MPDLQITSQYFIKRPPNKVELFVAESSNVEAYIDAKGEPIASFVVLYETAQESFIALDRIFNTLPPGKGIGYIPPLTTWTQFVAANGYGVFSKNAHAEEIFKEYGIASTPYKAFDGPSEEEQRYDLRLVQQNLLGAHFIRRSNRKLSIVETDIFIETFSIYAVDRLEKNLKTFACILHLESPKSMYKTFYNILQKFPAGVAIVLMPPKHQWVSLAKSEGYGIHIVNPTGLDTLQHFGIANVQDLIVV